MSSGGVSDPEQGGRAAIAFFLLNLSTRTQLGLNRADSLSVESTRKLVRWRTLDSGMEIKQLCLTPTEVGIVK